MIKKKKSLKSFNIATYLPWVFYAFALLLTTYLVEQGEDLIDSYLIAVVFFNGGIQGLWAAIGHLGFPGRTAKAIGWTSSGFQTEIGAANLALGILGLLSFVFLEWVVPVALFMVIFYSGCIYAHAKDKRDNQNNAPCNCGPMFYNTILVVVTLLIAIFI